MTNKEAAAIVERIRYYMEGGECWTPTEFKAMDMAIEALMSRDRPMKPVEKIRVMSELEDKHIEESWAVPHKKTICPKCGYLLNRVFIFGDYNTYDGSQCTYCETCGQAIDWSDF